ncbi:MAG: hypothetical protein N4A68_15105 [Maledivibacter sp.]|nr:hypothetical protein [Maledivibacter sp.]
MTLVKLTNGLGVTIDYSLTDLVKTQDEQLMKQMLKLMMVGQARKRKWY